VRALGVPSQARASGVAQQAAAAAFSEGKSATQIGQAAYEAAWQKANADARAQGLKLTEVNALAEKAGNAAGAAAFNKAVTAGRTAGVSAGRVTDRFGEREKKDGQWTGPGQVTGQAYDPFGVFSGNVQASLEAIAAQAELNRQARGVDIYGRSTSAAYQAPVAAPPSTGYHSKYVAPGLAWGIPDPRVAQRAAIIAQIPEAQARWNYLAKMKSQLASVLTGTELAAIQAEMTKVMQWIREVKFKYKVA
jgi:hypothetical protein